MFRHHDLAHERLNVVLAEARAIGISELLLEAIGKGCDRLAVDPIKLIAALPFYEVDLLAESSASSLMTGQTLFEVLVLGIDETCFDRFEQTLDRRFSGGALIAQRNDVALAFYICTGGTLKKLRKQFLKASRIEQALFKDGENSIVNLRHRDIVAAA